MSSRCDSGQIKIGTSVTHTSTALVGSIAVIDEQYVTPINAATVTANNSTSVLLINPKTHSAVGTEIGASHIKSGKEGTIVTAVCKAIHIGRTSHVWEIKITNDKGQIVSLVRFTTRIIERRK